MLSEPERGVGYQRIVVEVGAVLARCHCTSVIEERREHDGLRSVLQNDIESMDDTGNVTQNGEQDVDEEISVASSLKEDT